VHTYTTVYTFGDKTEHMYSVKNKYKHKTTITHIVIYEQQHEGIN